MRQRDGRSAMEPHFTGIGKPDPLKGDLKGWWSRRITLEDRLVYRVVGAGDEQRLEIAQCRSRSADRAVPIAQCRSRSADRAAPAALLKPRRQTRAGTAANAPSVYTVIPTDLRCRRAGTHFDPDSGSEDPPLAIPSIKGQDKIHGRS